MARVAPALLLVALLLRFAPPTLVLALGVAVGVVATVVILWRPVEGEEPAGMLDELEAARRGQR